MSAGLILGIFVILIGTSIILKGFGIDFPFFKIIFGLLIVAFGIKVMMGGFGMKCHKYNRNNVIFSEMHFRGNDVHSRESNVIFGGGKYDLRDLKPLDKNIDVTIHTVFGGTEIILDKEIPFKIVANSAFGGVELPEGNTIAFGTNEYRSRNFNADSAHINIKVDVVFGGVEFKVY